MHKFPTYQSIKIASDDLGVPVEVLRSLQRGSTPGFKSGRVDTRALLAFLLRDEQSDADGISVWRKRLTSAKARQEELRLARDKGELVPVAEVLAAMTAACSRWNALRSKLEMEWAPKLSGLDVPETRAEVRKFMDQIGGILRDIHQPADPKPAAKD